MKTLSTRKLALAGLFIALGLVLPFFTGQIPSLGSKLLPMHFPVLLAGFVCGWPYGLVVGFITPLLRSVLFGTPPMYPTAVAMTFELAVYGFATGFFYNALPKKNIFIYGALIISMVCGRIVWGIVSWVLYGLGGTAFTWQIFAGGSVLNAIPGIILQIVIIPVIIMALKKGNLIEREASA
jgi:thiamine transporter ThiT